MEIHEAIKLLQFGLKLLGIKDWKVVNANLWQDIDCKNPGHENKADTTAACTTCKTLAVYEPELDGKTEEDIIVVLDKIERLVRRSYASH